MSEHRPASPIRILATRATLILALVTQPTLATPVLAFDEEAMQQRMEELERQQRELLDELRSLRQELEEEKRKKAEAPAPAPAPVPVVAEGERVEEVERRQGVMARELRRLREALVLPETKELKSAYGLGPAASKVYGIERGLSLGGYGETNFKIAVSDKDGGGNEFDFVRFVGYVGYKFNDRIVLNSEIELEHATTATTVSSGNGSFSVEFATLDFFLHPKINARVGMMLVPVGFLNEIHEPPFYLGNVRPELERNILPTTWRQNGFGLFGELAPGLQYRTYGITSLNAEGFSASSGLRGGRQKGNREKANDWSWVARVDYSPLRLPGSLFGGSIYLGDQGQGESYGDPDDEIGLREVGVFTQLYEIHAQYRAHGFEARWLASYVAVDNASALSRDPRLDGPVGEVMLGTYVEMAYNFLPLILEDTTQYLAPWFRYTWYDTNNKVPSGFTRDPRQRRQLYQFGLAYKPIPQVVLKLDYHIAEREKGSAPDDLRIGAGFVF